MPNALIHETSPYLLQHAHNPVEWLPWGEEAFARARAEDKLVFLSVGYSTCHWCHVMERESFESEPVAAVLNRHFVNVKVDREERPDVDATYMAFVQATTGHGGWPMSVWLTPDGHPVVGGTYFPPHDRDGRAGLVRVCEEVARVWHEERGRLDDSARHAIGQLRAAAAPRDADLPGARVFGDFLDVCQRLFDEEHGGFGGAPKFPRPVVTRLLLQLGDRFAGAEEGDRCRAMAFATLDAMAAGGIRDHLGGGFHRYSVDRWWHVPHYEKMLYDQAQLATLYLEAWQAGGGDGMRDVAAEILDYVVREMRDPAGGFHAAEDADSLEAPDSAAKIEGAYWTWRTAEVQSLLDPRDAAWFCLAYGVEEQGNARPASDPHGELAGRNTLWRVCSDAEIARRFGVEAPEVAASLAASRVRLLAARGHRPRPHRDDKVVAAWNGLMLGALARGAGVLGRDDLAAVAGELARFLRDRMWDGKRLFRSWRAGRAGGAAFAADYAAVIHGMIEWHGLTGETWALGFADELQHAMEECCRAPGRSGYVMRASGHDPRLLVLEDDHDGAEPAAGHLAAGNLLRLAVLLDRPEWKQRAIEVMQGTAAVAREHPFAAPVLLGSLDLLERGVVKIDVRGQPDPELAALLRATHLPRAVWTRGPGDGEVIVCVNQTCLPPVRTAADWRGRMESEGREAAAGI